jgi:TonB-dependent SusC/RagA subfamily outer membrane receptor
MNLISCPPQSLRKKERGVLHQTLLVMRLIILLTILCCLKVTAAIHAQGISLNVKDAPIANVLDEIKKQSGYSLITKDDLLDNANKVTITIKNAGIKEALEMCFKNQPITYELVGKTIVIKPKSPIPKRKSKEILLFESPVRGIVTDTAGNPIIGATLRIRGTNITTVTDETGAFILMRAPENAVLEITFIGYRTKTVALTKDIRTLQVTLHTDLAVLKSVNVVSTGYQDLPLERATGSFDQIDIKLLNRSVSTDILSKLKGIASGLNFDNTAGNSLGIAIRGRSTLVSNTQPLIVLDNFPYEGDINNINPNDIESVTVLKDAAASSIWGAFAGNGVIVITTKKGKFNQPLSIDFNSNLTLQKKPNLFYAGNQFLSS